MSKLSYRALIIHLPNGRELRIEPTEKSGPIDALIDEIDRKITMSFATKQSDWQSSVLAIVHANKEIHIPYSAFRNGYAYWEVVNVELAENQ